MTPRLQLNETGDSVAIGDTVWVAQYGGDGLVEPNVFPAHLVDFDDEMARVHFLVAGISQPFVSLSIGQVYASEKAAWLHILTRLSEQSRHHYHLHLKYEAATHLIRQQHLESE